MRISLVLGFIAALVCTVLILILVTPKSKRETLPSFFRFLHDLFNFKWLIIEKILKTLYIFNTIFLIAFGFFAIFEVGSYRGSYALVGLLIMILGPIALRIVYEIIMMSILLVKNVITINNKLKEENEISKDEPFESNFKQYTKSDFNSNRNNQYVQQNPPSYGNNNRPSYGNNQSYYSNNQQSTRQIFCKNCGTAYNADLGVCPNCGSSNHNHY